MAAGNMKKKMLWCIHLFHKLYHVFILKLVNTSFSIKLRTHHTFPSPIFKLPQWGAADAEIKVPSIENTELKDSPFKAWSRSVYSHTCYAY